MSDVEAPRPRRARPQVRPAATEVGPADTGLLSRSRFPVALAVASFALLCTVALSHPYKLREPDPYAYRASIVALADGHLTLSQDEYDALQTKLSKVDDGWNSGTGILQWVQTSDGRWVSEKNPGYPFLALLFDAKGLIRLVPLLYGAIGCAGLWFGGRRWLGDWGAALAVGLFCSSGAVLLMAYEAYMPSFTDAALLAAGGGALIWAVLAVDRSWRRRTIVGTAAFLITGVAVSVRYSNLAVLAVFAIAAVVAACSGRRQLGWKVLPAWGVAAAIPLVLSAIYNQALFGNFTATGYASENVSFSWGSLDGNLHLMPKQLLIGMPVLVLAAVGVVVVLVTGLSHRRSSAGASSAGASSSVASEAVTEAVADASPSRWTVPLLVGWWIANWGVYAFYDWTARGGVAGGPAGFAGGFGGTGGLDGGGGSFMVVTRFYLPAMGAIALLAAWLLRRFSRGIGLAVLIGLFAFGGYKAHQGATGDYLYGTGISLPGFGGGPGGGPRLGPTGSFPGGTNGPG